MFNYVWYKKAEVNFCPYLWIIPNFSKFVVAHFLIDLCKIKSSGMFLGLPMFDVHLSVWYLVCSPVLSYLTKYIWIYMYILIKLAPWNKQCCSGLHNEYYINDFQFMFYISRETYEQIHNSLELISYVWWHSSAYICQIIMSTCWNLKSTRQFLLSTCRSFSWLVTYLFVRKLKMKMYWCLINAIQITAYFSENLHNDLTSQHS